MVAKKPKDLWAEVGRSGENGFHDDHYLRATKRTLPKLPKTLANRSATLFSAVEVAHPGASYNPSVDQHQTLLEEAAKQREQEMKKVKKVRRWMNGLSSLNQYEREVVNYLHVLQPLNLKITATKSGMMGVWSWK
jgi:hypothetical protein